jgi:hypothetical protein
MDSLRASEDLVNSFRGSVFPGGDDVTVLEFPIWLHFPSPHGLELNFAAAAAVV